MTAEEAERLLGVALRALEQIASDEGAPPRERIRAADLLITSAKKRDLVGPPFVFPVGERLDGPLE